MAKKANKKTMKKVFIGVGIGALVLVLGSMGLKLAKLDKTDEVSNVFGYEIGLISEEGKEVKGTTAMRTKNYVTVEGLVCDLKDDASITYQIFFYNADKEFVEVTESLSVDYDTTDADTVPEGAKYARVLITPLNDPEVSTTEIAGYAGELSIEYDK